MAENVNINEKSNIIQADEAQIYGVPAGGVAANIARDATLGAGVRSGSLDAATPLVLPPAIPIVIHTPTMWDSKFSEMGLTLKRLYERHCKSLTGVDIEYNMEQVETPVGQDGQNQETPTQLKRTQPAPSAVFDEVGGNLIWEFHRQWSFDISDPDTNAFAGRMDDPNIRFQSSAFAMAMLIIQPDPSFHPDNIISAHIISNMWPKGFGELGVERQVAQSKNMERTISLAGYLQHNDVTNEIGRSVASELFKLRMRLGTNRKTFATSDMVNTAIANSALKEELANIVAG